MYDFRIIVLCFFSLCLFNACGGAAAHRAAILSQQGQGGGVPVAPPEKNDTKLATAGGSSTETAPKPDDPAEFNYFPYDLQVDTIAWLACTTNNYPHIQAGAYFSRSGLRLSEYFLKQIKGGKSNKDMETLIKSSTKHKAQPYLAVNYKNKLLSFIKPSVAFNGGLSLSDLIPDLISNDKTRVMEYNGDPISAHIKNTRWMLNDNYRAGFEDELVLALYYKGGKNNAMLHQTGGVAGKNIYGRTYKLGLEDLDIADANDSADRYALTSVKETKLPVAPVQAEWSCPESLRLQIRRHPSNAYKASEWYAAQNAGYKEKYKNVAEALSASDPALRALPSELTCANSENGGAKLEVARAVLGNKKKWNINIGEKCISPNNSRIPCYWMSTQASYSDRLELRADQLKGNKACSVSWDKVGITKHCPRYLSICFRNN